MAEDCGVKPAEPATVFKGGWVKFGICVLALFSLAYGSTCVKNQAKDESVLVQMEQSWARALEHSDAAALDCILAQEFEDAGPDGAITDRATTLAKAAEKRSVRHELSDLHAHVQGDSGYIRGTAAAINPEGKTVARVRFTDVYVYRDGRWQCVAGHESLISKGQ